jgi:hypothetical protein
LIINVNAQDVVPELQDLIGVRARDGEFQLEQRGYQFQKASQSDIDSYTYWSQSNTGECIVVRTNDGRYASIVSTPQFDCKSDANSSSNADDPEAGSLVSSLQDLVGAGAGRAENQLNQRGYVFRNSTVKNDTIHAFWTEDSTGNCVRVITADGKYKSFRYTPAKHCNKCFGVTPLVTS